MSFNVYSLTDPTVGGITAEDCTGVQFSVENGVIVQVVVPAENVAELLANFDADSGTSPLVSYARPLARAILHALAWHQAQGD